MNGLNLETVLKLDPELTIMTHFSRASGLFEVSVIKQVYGEADIIETGKGDSIPLATLHLLENLKVTVTGKDK